MITATCYTVLGVANKMATVLINCLIWDKHASLLGGRRGSNVPSAPETPPRERGLGRLPACRGLRHPSGRAPKARTV